ncbi:MAG: DNA cytosine methyltransferase [Deltaproteobacteria bacterium]|jgi:DNA (cytosine-5)-methyltransferase 1|nr:DNA cytosine methyltransferase [Deltaproteobacteria bacterium]
MPAFTFGELFCGPGGLAQGALEAAIDDSSYRIVHVWATDIDWHACETYRDNIFRGRGDGRILCGDVRHLDMGTLPPVDALAFGFPCNDFSIVGEKRGVDGDYGPLYKYGIKAIRHFRPKFFIAENVSGLKNANEGKALRTILGEMAGSGYRLTSHLYRFEEYGVPQTRHRVIIVGVRDDQDAEFRVPSPELRRREDNSCRWAIETPPVRGLANNELTRQSKAVVERLRHILPGQNAFTASLPDKLRLNVKSVTMSQIYRRLEPDKPAYTVTGSGGGGTHVYHWSEPRALTNRERARLQTFPDDFVFSGTKESVRRQIGMAVPVEGARIIFEAVLNSFALKPYPSVRPNINPDLT